MILRVLVWFFWCGWYFVFPDDFSPDYLIRIREPWLPKDRDHVDDRGSH